VVRQPDDVIDARRLSNLVGSIVRPIVDDQRFDHLDPRDGPGERLDRMSENTGFVITGDLDYQFHKAYFEKYTTVHFCQVAKVVQHFW
jgi:hypothetical protein